MYHDLKQIYRWDGMKDIAYYAAKCPICRYVKVEHLKPGGLTEIIKVPTLKWKAINMDFVVGLPKTRRHHYSKCVIVDSMTTFANFIVVKSTYRAEDYAILYID